MLSRPGIFSPLLRTLRGLHPRGESGGGHGQASEAFLGPTLNRSGKLAHVGRIRGFSWGNGSTVASGYYSPLVVFLPRFVTICGLLHQAKWH